MRGQRREGRNPSVEPEQRSSCHAVVAFYPLILRKTLYYYWMGHLTAVRSGSWKLHRFQIEQNRNGMTKVRANELYNLANDIGETTNVAQHHPAVVQRLLKLINQARNDLGDGPKPGANVRPAGHVDPLVC